VVVLSVLLSGLASSPQPVAEYMPLSKNDHKHDIPHSELLPLDTRRRAAGGRHGQHRRLGRRLVNPRQRRRADDLMGAHVIRAGWPGSSST